MNTVSCYLDIPKLHCTGFKKPKKPQQKTIRQVKEILTRQATLELEKQLSYGISYYLGARSM